MYELKQGTARLVTALYNRKNDVEAIRKLAVLLDYQPEQLMQDTQALYDFYQKVGKNEKAVEE